MPYHTRRVTGALGVPRESDLRAAARRRFSRSSHHLVSLSRLSPCTKLLSFSALHSHIAPPITLHAPLQLFALSHGQEAARCGPRTHCDVHRILQRCATTPFLPLPSLCTPRQRPAANSIRCKLEDEQARQEGQREGGGAGSVDPYATGSTTCCGGRRDGERRRRGRGQ